MNGIEIINSILLFEYFDVIVSCVSLNKSAVCGYAE